jgi:hypothetical protein
MASFSDSALAHPGDGFAAIPISRERPGVNCAATPARNWPASLFGRRNLRRSRNHLYVYAHATGDADGFPHRLGQHQPPHFIYDD